MGLDNGFVIRSKKYPDLYIEITYFRKYYELNDWMLMECEHDGDYGEYVFQVKEENIVKLRREIAPIAEKLLKLGLNKVGYYDEHGYPKKFDVEFYGSDFNPVGSRSFMPGTKLCRLYFALYYILEIFDNNRREMEDLCITFYSSF